MTNGETPRTREQIISDAMAREDRTIKARPGEFDTLSAMAKEGLMYNWAGVLWCLEKDPTP
jgi:hypothetical protein